MPKLDKPTENKVRKLLKQQLFQQNPTKAIWDELMHISEKLDGIISKEENN